MLVRILKILLIFLLGALGGVWAQTSLLPFLMDSPVLQREMIVNPTKTIIVRENVVLTEAIEKVEKTVIGVRTETAAGKVLEGSGLALTSDGLVVILAELVPQGSDFYFYVDGKWPSYQILKRDPESNLALVKIGEKGLSTAGFANLEKIKLGERVFLLGMEFTPTTTDLLIAPDMFVDEGSISSLSEQLIQTNIYEPRAAGAPLFDIMGNVVGLSAVDETGRVSAIPISIIRAFAGL